MTVTLGDIPGISLGVASAGLYGSRDDVVVLIGAGVAAGVVTRSSAAAAPCRWTRARVPGPVRAIVVNAGNANAATGEKGEEDTLAMAEAVAKRLGAPIDEVLVCSTGVIGVPMPIADVVDGIAQATMAPDASTGRAARAIMTTDTSPKMAGVETGAFKVAGIAKGSGMIHPNMATMLAFVATDAPVMGSDLQTLLESVVARTFNAISVDGDTSTNDTVLLVSTADPMGAPPIAPDTDMWRALEDALEDVCRSLAKAIARDGEGAEHLIEARVNGLPTDGSARAAAKAIVSSNLVKSAIQGKDPNWGRIIGALGAAEVPGLARCDVSLCGVPVLAQGSPVLFDEPALKVAMAKEEIVIEVDLTEGQGRGVAWGCDLSEEYVRINADYRS